MGSPPEDGWLDVIRNSQDWFRDAIGDQWITQSSDLSKLSKFAEDDSFRKNFRDIKMHNKEISTYMIESRLGLQVSPDAIFDAQIKRLHEYKRQHLNLHILTLYRRLLHDPDLDIPPRVFLRCQSRTGYHMAKVIIHAINLVAAKINSDPRIKDKLKVIFWPNYGVSVAEE